MHHPAVYRLDIGSGVGLVPNLPKGWPLLPTKLISALTTRRSYVNLHLLFAARRGDECNVYRVLSLELLGIFLGALLLLYFNI